MSFDRLYRASQYVTLLLATLILSVDATVDNRFAMLYPVVVGGLAALAFMTVDLDPRRGLPRDVANFLGLIALVFGLLEHYNDPSTLLLAIGHTLVYLMVIKFFLPKTVEDDWFLNLIGLVVAVIGVYSSASDIIGFLLVSWAMFTLWTFGLFFLRRETLRRGPPPGVTIQGGPEAGDPYRGLFNAGFFASTLAIAATTLALGVVIFLLMPRWPVKGVNRYGHKPDGKHLTGFTDKVNLRTMGEILENDSVVMSVEFSDGKNEIVTPEPEILLRGITLTLYDNGEWTRDEAELIATERVTPDIPTGTPILRQRYKLEPTETDVLFAVRPVLRVARAAQGEIMFNQNDGTIHRRDLREDFENSGTGRPNKYDYTVISGVRDPEVQPEEVTPDKAVRNVRLINVPDALRSPLLAISRPILQKLNPNARQTNLDRARALEHYLRDGDFTYSLKMTHVDQTLDPVLDFLVNRKEGHCEYFASALALLCRAEGIPARLVNGFKGGDWEGLGKVLHVREKHAHSWVEVLVSSDGHTARWATLDPTPSRQQAEVVAQVGGNAVKIQHYFTNPLRSFWTFGIAGFDADRQERTIYAPLRALAAEIMRGFRVMGTFVREVLTWFYFDSVGQFFSIRGFVVSVVVMLLLVGVYRLLSWIVAVLLGRRKGGGDGLTAEEAEVAFYHRLVKLLVKIGVERPAPETPREFARRASHALETRPAAAMHTALPENIVEFFYAKRFGGQELTGETLSELNSELGRLEAAIGHEGGD